MNNFNPQEKKNQYDSKCCMDGCGNVQCNHCGISIKRKKRQPSSPTLSWEEQLNEMVRDFCSVVPCSKSEVRSRIEDLLLKAREHGYQSGIKTMKSSEEMLESFRDAKTLIKQAQQEVVEEIKQIFNRCRTERGLIMAVANFLKKKN